MTAMAYAGDLMAALAFIFGLCLWSSLSAPQRLVTAFCGASALCGLGQVICQQAGTTTAFWGNLWDLSLLVMAAPAIWETLRRRRRSSARLLWAIAMAVWITALLLDGDLEHFAFRASAIMYACTAVPAILLVEQFAQDSGGALRSPAFIRGLVFLAACSVDAAATPLLDHWQTLGVPFLRTVFAFRNLIWMLAYAALFYSLAIPERAPRSSEAPAPEGRDPHHLHPMLG